MQEEIKLRKQETANTLAILFSMQGFESQFMKMSEEALNRMYRAYNQNAMNYNHMEDAKREAEKEAYILRGRLRHLERDIRRGNK